MEQNFKNKNHVKYVTEKLLLIILYHDSPSAKKR